VVTALPLHQLMFYLFFFYFKKLFPISGANAARLRTFVLLHTPYVCRTSDDLQQAATNDTLQLLTDFFRPTANSCFF
jgi:hypothetical protein